MLNPEAAQTLCVATSLFNEGKSAADIWSSLVSSGVGPADAEALVRALGVAVSLFDQGKDAAEVWSALVSSGVEPAVAEALVKEILGQREHLGSGFCKKCYASSTFHSPGNVSTTNGTGSMFYGNDRVCLQCGSAVRVLWVVFCYLPIFPLGTYRYGYIREDRSLYTKKSRFIARRTQTNMEQVAIHYALGVAVLVLSMLVASVIKAR